MSYSLNETEAMAKRATRGAGYSWGLAEEAGKAARWLCANGLDGSGILVRLLDQVDGQALTDLSPRSIAGEWVSASGQLCPLIAGAALSDSAALLGDRDIVMRNVLFPALVLPFGAACAMTTGQAVKIIWNGQTVVCDASGRCGEDAELMATASDARQVSVALGGSVRRHLPQGTRATANAANWAMLDRFAYRTFAPAPAISRLLGAGSGLSDND